MMQTGLVCISCFCVESGVGSDLGLPIFQVELPTPAAEIAGGHTVQEDWFNERQSFLAYLLRIFKEGIWCNGAL